MSLILNNWAQFEVKVVSTGVQEQVGIKSWFLVLGLLSLQAKRVQIAYVALLFPDIFFYRIPIY